MNKRRLSIYDKSQGVCWYCGCTLRGKKWHIDHIKPLRRDIDGDLYAERDYFDNLVPACAPCNLLKSVYSVEDFRSEIEKQGERARKSSVNFRTAERFGLLEVINIPVVFWFEENINE